MICAEYYAFEFITVAAGTLGVIELASITMVYSYSTLLFMIALGIQEGTCTLIGNCIGANNVPLAKQFYHLSAKITTVVALLCSLITLLARKPIVALITSDQNVQEMVEGLFILVSIMKLVDSFQCYLQGPIRAMGLQKAASYWAIACYWVIGVPLSAILGLWKDFGTTGLFTGIVVGVFLQSTAYFFILMK